jgi:pimeloyl-ACP methyl ester carboxylesterase
MSVSSQQKLRILCLHGYHGSARVLGQQLAALAQDAADVADFVYVDAPSLAAGDYGWWHATATGSSPDTARLRYVGWERTRAALVSTFERLGPFDGVLGFSQGAALAGLLVGSRAPQEQSQGVPPLSFDFAIMIGGFVSGDALLARLYLRREAYDLPSLHVLGRTDVVVPPDASRELAACFARPTVLEHAAGHVIPSDAPARRAFLTFLEQRLRARRQAATAAEPPLMTRQ